MRTQLQFDIILKNAITIISAGEMLVVIGFQNGKIEQPFQFHETLNHQRSWKAITT